MQIRNLPSCVASVPKTSLIEARRLNNNDVHNSESTTCGYIKLHIQITTRAFDHVRNYLTNSFEKVQTH